ncbi:MAG: PAS domain S-box protein [Candidatus Bathyarchaeia archaeon]
MPERRQDRPDSGEAEKKTTLSSSESELRYRRLFETAPDGILIIDFGSERIIDANPFLTQLLGYPRDELVGKTLWEIGPFSDVVRSKIAFDELKTKGSIRYEDLPLETKDGRQCKVEFVSNVHALDGAKVIQCNILDITERKQAEDAMRRQADLLQKTFDSMTDAVFILDASLPTPTVVECNQAACAVFGYDREEMLGKTTEFLHLSDETLREFRALLYSAVEEGRLPFRLAEFHMKRKNGMTFPSEHTVSQLTNIKGERTAWVSIVRDITEHKLMEEALRGSEERHRLLFEKSPVGIGLASLDGKVLAANETMQAITGYSLEELKRIALADTYENPADRKKLLDSLDQAGSVADYPVRLRRKDGTPYDALLTISRVHIADKEFLQTTCVDITERKRMEKEIRSLAEFPSENPNPVLRLDREGTVLAANEASKLLIQEWRSGIRQVAPKFWRDLVADALSTGQSRNVDIEFGGKSYTFFVKPLVETGCVNFYGRDITERKRAEQKLRLQSEITENMFEGIHLTRASDGVIVYANPRFEQMFGYGPGELIGKNTAVVNAPVEGKSPEDTYTEIETSLNESGAWIGEVRNVKKDGTLFWCRANVSALESSEYGRIWVSVQEDITESKRTAEKLDAIHKHSVQLGAENNIDEIVTSTLDAMEHTLGFHYAGFEEVKDGFVQIKKARGIPASLEPLPLDGPGIVVKVARTKETIRISDTRSEPAFVDTRTKSPDGQPVRMLSELAVPVVVNGSVLVVLNVENAQLGAFTESDQVLLETLAMHVSSAIARLEQIEALRSRAEELDTLQATVLDITAPYDLSTLLERIVERAVRLLGAKSGGMYLCDPEKREARCVVSYNTPHDYRDVVLKYGEGAAGRVAETGRPVIVNDYRLWEGRAEVYEKERPFSALLSAPMIWQDRVIGIIHVMEESKARRFTQADLEMLMLFANHATIAVERTRTEEALKESEERFRGIAERSFDAILTVDLEGRITYASPAVERITGYSQSEMLGASFQKFLPESEIPNGMRILSEAVTGDAATSVEANILKKDGSIICFEFAGSPILKDGKLAGFQGIARDVTERKRMETALKESEERYRMMFRSMGDAVSVYEAVDQGNDFVFRDFNEAAERIEKVKSEDVIGRSVLEVFPGVKDLGLFEVFQRVWKTGKPEHLPAGIYKDKRMVGWRENYVYKLPSGELVAVYQDITDRKRLEEELRQYSLHLERLVNERTKELRSARERLEYVISSNPAVIYTGKPLADGSDFVLTYVSERVSSMIGFEPQDFVGHPEVWERRVHPEDLRPALSQVPRLWKEGQYAFEYRFLHRDGNYRWIREEAKLVRDTDGKPIEVNGYWTDVSERKRLEEELAKSQRLATIVETSAMVGHDLRNPLQGIAGIVYLAKRDLESRKAADRKAAAALLDTIQEQIVYMDKIVSDLQDYSQPLAPKLTETDLPNLIRQTLSTIKIPKAVKVTVEIEKPAENAMIDPTLMRRTLTNLTINAIQAMPKRGKLTVRARSKGNSTVITVEDTGEGIPKKNLTKLFSPFFTTKAKGQGLGLAVCKRLVEAQGGTITVKSKPRKGTAFTIKMPRGKREVAS